MKLNIKKWWNKDYSQGNGNDTEFQRSVTKIVTLLTKIPGFKRNRTLDNFIYLDFYDALRGTIEDFLDFITMKQFRKNFKSGLDYFKLGFHSADYDWSHLLGEFVWKLERLQKHFSKNCCYIDNTKIVKIIEEITTLFNKVIKDEYFEELEKTLDKKYGENIRYVAESDDPFNQGNGRFKNKFSGSMVFYKREKQTLKNETQIRRDTLAAYDKAEELRMKDLKKALDLVYKHLFSMWD